MSYLLAMDAKVTKCFCLITWLFFGQPDFLPKFLQNSDFRPCATYFTSQEEKLKPKYKRVWKLFRKIYFHVFFCFFWNASIWCKIDECVHIWIFYHSFFTRFFHIFDCRNFDIAMFVLRSSFRCRWVKKYLE